MTRGNAQRPNTRRCSAWWGEVAFIAAGGVWHDHHKIRASEWRRICRKGGGSPSKAMGNGRDAMREEHAENTPPRKAKSDLHGVLAPARLQAMETEFDRFAAANALLASFWKVSRSARLTVRLREYPRMRRFLRKVFASARQRCRSANLRLAISLRSVPRGRCVPKVPGRTGDHFGSGGENSHRSRGWLQRGARPRGSKCGHREPEASDRRAAGDTPSRDARPIVSPSRLRAGSLTVRPGSACRRPRRQQ